MAMRWMAALVCRLPPRLSRCLRLLADQTGMGATPGPHGVGVSVSEPGDVGGFADQFGRGEGSASGEFEKSWARAQPLDGRCHVSNWLASRVSSLNPGRLLGGPGSCNDAPMSIEDAD